MSATTMTTSNAQPAPLHITSAAQRVLILGGTSGTGRHIVEQALEAGYAVRLMARNPGKVEIAHPALEVVAGDATVYADVERAVDGVDAVISAVGTGALDGKGVRATSAAHLVQAMERMGVERLISLSMLGIKESRQTLPFLLKYVLVPIFLALPTADHTRQEDAIAASGLDWTIVRPPTLTDDGATGAYAHGALTEEGLTYKISRADVAAFMVEELVGRRYVRAAAGLSYRA